MLALHSHFSCCQSHNTRLVAWEPAIEPWALNAQIGVDLTRALKLPPMAARRLTSSLGSSVHSMFSPTSGRLADWGRLLRSPFGPGTASVTKDNVPRPAETDFDFCFLLLMVAASDLIRNASSLSMTRGLLPGNRPAQWLRNFGYPTSASLDSENLLTHPAVLCWLNDIAPLDVNVTGALIDDLWEHIRDGDASTRAPHWIRNNTGLVSDVNVVLIRSVFLFRANSYPCALLYVQTIRFEEVLDVDRMARGEIAARVILSHGTESPLSLKRSLSQSCDPHRAFVKMEIGSYLDTCGRLDLAVPKGTRSSAFSYRIAAKIPVDTVGVQRFPLDLNYESYTESNQSQAWVIVRISLRGGIKFVSVESPLTIRNISDTDILCEARDEGLSLIWRSVIPKRDVVLKASSPEIWPVPVPADIASYVHNPSCLFSVMAVSPQIAIQDETEFPSTNKHDVTTVKVPPPYSRSSLDRGVIAETDICVPVLTTDTKATAARHLNVLSFRVGALALEQAIKSQKTVKPSPEVPEQRLILFRSPLVIRNHLAYAVEIQMRALRDSSLVIGDDSFSSEWMHLGTLDCGDGLSWSLASPSEKVQMRIRFTSPEGGPFRQFPSWSTPTVIPSDRDALAFGKHRSPSSRSTSHLAKMKVLDSSNVALFLSASLSRGGQPSDNTTSTVRDVKEYSEALPTGSRVVTISVPFLVVDGSGLNLEYKCGSSKVAGQTDSEPSSYSFERRKTGTLGLGELLDDDDLLYLPSRMPFTVTMIGDERSTELAVRRRVSRMRHANESRWSVPIYLTRVNTNQDTTVLPPGDSAERFALCTRILRAPSAFGGHLGTRLIHLVCRFLVVNELGRDIEVASGSHTRECATVIKADGRPRPFHFYGSEYAFFRLKEYGWQWSGRFNVKKKRKGVTLRVRHNLKGHTMIVNIEFTASRSGTTLIVFRVASHAPYRLENNTLLPLHFHQTSIFQSLRMTQRHQEAVILPYHSSDFAWDEPDFGRRSISILVADFGDLPNRMTGTYLGCFRLDYLAPGTDVKLAASRLELEAKIVADGPTRVLRISEVSETGPVRLIESGGHQFQGVTDHHSSLTTMLHLSFHGIGISVIDWSPRELVYIRFDDILIERRNDGSKESAGASVAKITVDNQLWVTPYPVALKMGFPRAQQRRNRKLNAISLSWVRALGASTGYNDLLLFEKAELATQPITIRVDGQLAGLILNMLRQIKRGMASRDQSQTSRSAVLGRALGMADRLVDSEAVQQLSGKDQLSLFVDDLYEALDYMATSSIAAKLRSQYRHPNVAIPVTRKRLAFGKSPPGQKVYLEKLKISGLAAELSWNGRVPVHWWIFPSIAFEGLPLSLGPFSISHSYGTMEEHLQSVASHYISVRRGIDLVVGVLWRKPFFLPREITTYFLSGVAAALQASERGLLTLVSSKEAESTGSSSMYHIVVDPVASLSAATLHHFGRILQVSSSIVRHGTVHHRPGGDQRQRNPRLFTHVDGNDLLVDFQEGENAGKALLSRVRMGLHLGEGYVYHVEGALETRKASQGWIRRNVAPMNLIVMITLERILVVKGELDAHFCEVVWETPLSHLVNVEFFKLEQDKTHDLVILWFLTGTETVLDLDDRPARVFLADAFGLDTLRSKATLIPKAKTETFLKTLASFKASLLADELIVYA
jgi:SHR-binding domain of vacuolar-sorting associated protein 13